MKLPQEIVSKYGTTVDGNFDADAYFFTDMYDERPNSKILVIGAHDESTANMLADAGNDVYGVDLRPYDNRLKECNYTYIQSDFCNLPRDFLLEHISTFDSIVSLSTIEHFGLNTYNEGFFYPYYDIAAMQVSKLLLKNKGTLYLTVPYGNQYVENPPHWRIYNWESLVTRLYMGYSNVIYTFFNSGMCKIDGELLTSANILTKSQADNYTDIIPHVTILARFMK